MSNSGEKQEAVSPSRVADVGGFQAQSEVEVFGVAKSFFDGESPAVESDNARRTELGARGGEAPDVLHALVVDDDDGRDLGPVVGDSGGLEHRSFSSAGHTSGEPTSAQAGKSAASDASTASPTASEEAASTVSPLAEDLELLKRTEQGVVEPTPSLAPGRPVPVKWWTTESAMTMSSVILGFGLLVIVISGFLALKRLNHDAIVKLVVIPMVIMSAVFLVVAGYSDQQIAPAMGLLGTIVGYVLGSPRSPETKSEAALVATRLPVTVFEQAEAVRRPMSSP